MNTPEFDHLEISVLLRILEDPETKVIAIKYYGLAELNKLVDYLKTVKSSSDNDRG